MFPQLSGRFLIVLKTWKCIHRTKTIHLSNHCQFFFRDVVHVKLKERFHCMRVKMVKEKGLQALPSSLADKQKYKRKRHRVQKEASISPSKKLAADQRSPKKVCESQLVNFCVFIRPIIHSFCHTHFIVLLEILYANVGNFGDFQ